MTTPSFELDQDHLDLREWVHTFAADVVRPAAAEWDEKEEFPWPVLEEAAKAGLYSVDFIVAQASTRPGSASRSAWRSCSGVTPGSGSPSSAPRSRPPVCGPTAPTSR